MGTPQGQPIASPLAMVQELWQSALHQEMKELLARSNVGQEFGVQILDDFERPAARTDARRPPPGSLPVFVFAVGLTGRHEHVIAAALAVDLYLLACNLLDFIEDGDGDAGSCQPQTLNRATALLLLGHMALSRLGERNEHDRARQATERLEIAVLRSCQGQALDLGFESRHLATEAQYLQMVEWKSSSLMSGACSAASLLSTGDPEKIEAAVQYGRFLGMSRQMGNDAMDIVSETGKSDIRRRKKTLPVIHALEEAGGDDRTFLRKVYAGTNAIAPDEESRIRQIIIASGGVHYTWVLSDIYRQKAIAQIQRTGLSTEMADTLAAMASPGQR